MRTLLARVGVCAASTLLGWGLYSWMVRTPQDGLLAAQHALRLGVEVGKQAQDLRKQAEHARQCLDAGGPTSPSLAMSALLDTLTSDLDDLGIGGRRWNLAPPVAGGGFEDLTVSVAFDSSFESVGTLLQRVDQYPGELRVTQLTMRRQSSPGAPPLSVTLELVNRVVKSLPSGQRSEATP